MFVKTSSDLKDLGCPITDYRIDKVIKGTSNDKVKNFDSLFNITSAGIFKILNFTKAYEKYRVYISAYNTGKWSDSETEGWLIEITFDSV